MTSNLPAEPRKAATTILNGRKLDRVRILIVDDNEADQRLASIRLDQFWPFHRDVHVEFAGDGRTALEKLRGQSYVLVLLDWKLPVAGEGEVLRVLRQQGSRVPVIVVSSAEREDIEGEIESLGAAYVNKNQLGSETFREAILNSFRSSRIAIPPPNAWPEYRPRL
jgi:CheY-like chemotaxis protein